MTAFCGKMAVVVKHSCPFQLNLSYLFFCSCPTLNCLSWKGLMTWLTHPRWPLSRPPLPSFASTLRPCWQNLQRQNSWSLTWWISSGCRGEKALTQMCLPLSAYMFSQSSRLVSQQETLPLQSDTEMLRYFDGVFQLERKKLQPSKGMRLIETPVVTV